MVFEKKARLYKFKVLRLFRMLFGLIFMIIGILGSIVLVYTMLSSPSAQPKNTIYGVIIAIYFSMTIVGWFLYEGRKDIILYLRRFKSDESNLVITRVMKKAIRKRCRLIALDDEQLNPVLIKDSDLFSNLVWMFPILFMIIIGFSVLIPTKITQQIFLARHNIIIMLGCTFISINLLYSIFGFGQKKLMYAYTKDEINAIVERIEQLKSWTTAPRSLAPIITIVKVIEVLWKKAVIDLSNEACVVIIDVSIPSISILWELELVSANMPNKMMVIGNKNQIQKWMRKEKESEGLLTRFRLLLRKTTILEYDISNASVMRNFFRKVFIEVKNIQRQND